ncbi:MAG: ABC transporter permease [Verrucomicrobiota bacterium]
MKRSLQNILTIFQRETVAYFTSPIAFAIIIIFLLISSAFAFTFGNLLEAGDASLGNAFFFWHPWFYLVLAPAVGMRLWSDEQRQGTIELLLTMPIAPWQAIFGKYVAACFVWFCALLLTFPLWITISFLGEPDHGVIFVGYIASFLVVCTCLAITTAVSSLTRNQVVCFIVSTVICLGFTMIGFGRVEQFLNKIFSPEEVSRITSFSFYQHFNNLMQGALYLKDVFYFVTLIAVSLLITSAVIRAKRA